MSASTASQAFCPICKEEIEDSNDNWVAIQWKGAKGINDVRIATNDTKASNSIQQWYITSCGNSVKSQKGTKFLKHIL